MMKTTITIFGAVVLVLFTGAALAEPEITRERITWEQVATLDGEALYSNLCAACHGPGGKGDGAAALASHNKAPDLTQIAADNDGEFPHRRVQITIGGKNRDVSYDSFDCPAWEQQFMYAEPGLNPLRREAVARDRLHVLTNYVESLQADPASALVAHQLDAGTAQDQ
jgi:cytochrome c553